MTETIRIYTDGACSGNQFETNTGGWGAILEYGGREKALFGGEADTTNNRMELCALIAGLEALKKKGYEVHVFSDSSYLTNCLRNRWYERWRGNGWMTQAKKPVENRDLWERLLAFLPDYEFRFFLVKGHVRPDASDGVLRRAFARFREHNGDGFSYEEFLHVVARNNEADALANRGVDAARAGGGVGGDGGSGLSHAEGAESF
ncbi:MAG: ribonuclease HI [Clostridiales Family XIII bacterium]|jgi:ribonuclease HI|nr:ribonuclease HI [Clostridiales Family XIII bacterium]